VELAGQQYGRLVVLQYAWRIRGIRYWHCGCTCGNVKVLRQDNFIYGRTKSCGCLRREYIASVTLEVKPARRTYNSWRSMLERCYNPHCKGYCYYGGRGIRVCRRWRESFANFLADMGDAPPGLTLDRRDNDRGYSPGNCRWATRVEQNQNMRRNVFITYKGKTQVVSAWAREYGLHPEVVRKRLYRGWTLERALTEAVQPSRKLGRS
jgi:hypothetical protein